MTDHTPTAREALEAFERYVQEVVAAGHDTDAASDEEYRSHEDVIAFLRAAAEREGREKVLREDWAAITETFRRRPFKLYIHTERGVVENYVRNYGGRVARVRVVEITEDQ